jgi:hypothetical protein
MFSVAGWAVFYPKELFPYALLGLPMLGLFVALGALAVWNGSRIGWALNFLFWGDFAGDSIRSIFAGDSPLLAGDFLHSFNYQVMRLSGAAVLLVLLCWPSFFKWVWRAEPRAAQAGITPQST